MKEREKLSTHHCFPKSRFPEFNRPEFCVEVPFCCHMAWHVLFGNLSCVEVVELLLSGDFQFPAFETKQWKAWMHLWDHNGIEWAVDDIWEHWFPRRLP